MENFHRHSKYDVASLDFGRDARLDVRAWPRDGSETLLVLFHGAVNRSKRALPAFFNYRDGAHAFAHQLAISDPSLSVSEDVTNGWFAGHTGFRLQELLPDFIRSLVGRLGIKRVVFAGSSGGGFASLFYSASVEGSVAIAFNPQVNINSYYSGRRESYLNACWPGVEPESESFPYVDNRFVYSKACSNTVVYVQSALDLPHVRNQLIPFLSSMEHSNFDNLLLHTSYWGKPGHSGAIPHEEMNDWVRAVLSAPATDPQSIFETFQLLRPEGGGPVASSVRKAEESSGLSERDRKLVELMVQYELEAKGRD